MQQVVSGANDLGEAAAETVEGGDDDGVAFTGVVEQRVETLAVEPDPVTLSSKMRSTPASLSASTWRSLTWCEVETRA